MKLTVKLPVLAFGAILLTAVACGIAAVLVGERIMRDTAYRDNRGRVEDYASAVSNYMENARSLIDTLAALPEQRDISRARELAALLIAKSQVFEYVTFLTTEGVVGLMEPRAFEENLVERDLSFHAWFRNVREKKATYVGSLHISQATRRPSVVVATPTFSADGRILGYWAGGIRLKELSEIGLPDGNAGSLQGASFITDGRGLIIAHQTTSRFVEDQTDFSAAPSVALALAGKSGSSEFFNPIEQEQKFAAYRPMPDLGWVAVHYESVADSMAPLKALEMYIALSGVLLAMTIGAIVYFVARRFTEPITLLATAARTIGTGEYKFRVDRKTSDEFDELAAEFSRMANALAGKDAIVRERTVSLETANLNLTGEIAERKKLEEQLRNEIAERMQTNSSLEHATLNLKRSNEELEQFAYVASHDLQEPLRMIVGYVQLLEKRLAGKLDEDAREFMGYAVDGALRMQNLIQDILAYSRVTTKGKDLQPVDSAACLKDALDQLATRIAETGATITASALPVVMADRSQLVQLFQNLVGNAIKFSKDVPKVHVEAQRQGGWRRFSVTDNGIGIEPDYRAQLFVIFKRLHTRREYPGTGIGLAICKRIVERHGGEIGIDSAPGGGTTFWFTLPEEPIP